MNNDAISDANDQGADHNVEPRQPVQPRQIGRYRIEKLLGQGSFGVVWLARDEQLQRWVAVKVPHRRCLSESQDVAVSLAEARAAAGLDHPNIVPIYDVDRSDEFPCYIVSKYIEGAALSERIKQNRPSPAESAELVATIAGALHHTHRKRLVHRDVKPGNILIDANGNPYIVDFGLASKDEKLTSGFRYAGSPAYMSPEQARGEGHRVDGRSDIFSLGVVFYELLTGSRPFHGESRDELFEQIRSLDPWPPRQHDDGIPKELERICMKALCKRASERYGTAKDMAEDLRHWIDDHGGATFRPGVTETGAPVPAGNGKQIFLSHASPDAEAAERLCGLIEAQGVGCWIAPRDVKPGDDYGESIIKAIESTSVTVMLLSSHSNASNHVRNEIERATSKRKRVIPVRLENILPNKSMELHLSTAQWVDAPKLGLDQVALQLVRVVRGDARKTEPTGNNAPARSTNSAGTFATATASQSGRLHIVPKGLRSFDAHDADFFLELVPGPRDREGFPDSIRFWKTRIEEMDVDQTFPVGLIYGPSGCGKSSLIKAGLLPRLSEKVIAVYVEATAGETETRLLNGVRKRCPALPVDLNLAETIAALRRGQGLAAGQKILLVLDQFEQWLHARNGEQETELVQALRQCDGGRVQCIVMVRDDFWLAVSRFLRELEIRLEGANSALADLFDADHARKVLAAFGRAFGKLPEIPGPNSPDQQQFLTRAVEGLAQQGKVISVRLALFAEMMKSRPWTLASLREVGGTEGVGVTFLEAMFSAAAAPPDHRYHQKAARAVLKSLLPESGTNIKGHMKSQAELLEASGYANRPKDFDDLIRILDSEIRLLTPTDPQGKEGAAESTTQSPPGNKYYQLTHDYLVPALRDWLTQKQKETRRGRAELLLADRAGVWNSRPENRQLPSFRQWLSIRWLTRKSNWTPPQRKMMARASRVHAVRGTAIALLLALSAFAALTARRMVDQQQKETRAAGLVRRLIDADMAQVPAIVSEMSPYRQWADPLLRQENAKAAPASRQKLRTSLALLPVDGGQVDFLYARLLTAEPNEVPAIRAALFPHVKALRDKLWSVMEEPENGRESTRLRAGAALAMYDPNSEKWVRASCPVVNDLVRENTIFLGQWSEAFRPVKNRLIPALTDTFRDRRPGHSAERSLATNLLTNYAGELPQVLAELLMEGDEKQFVAIYPKVSEQAEQSLPFLIAEIDQKLPAEAADDAREKLARGQANAAVALLKMHHPAKVWPLLRHSPDPRVRSYLIHRFSPLGADSRAIINRLEEEKDVSIRRALILSLGEFGEQEVAPAERETLTTKLRLVYRTDPDPGLHAAAEWLLRTWQENDWLKEVNEQWAKDAELRTQKLRDIDLALKKETANAISAASPQWFVDGQGQTMVVIPGPVEFVMGSPLTEPSRQVDERQHRRRIGRTFALGVKSVTVEQYRRFDQKFPLPAGQTPDLPVASASWYQAAAYCNWLSSQEKIPRDQWCYEISNGEVTKLRENYLSLTGYRLPTEAEMEYAARAEASTSRCYGQTEDLLENYAWYIKNSQDKTWPVGTKKPNDLGFFDLHGNVWNWCQEQYKPYPQAKEGQPVEDQEGDLGTAPTDFRVLRNGSFIRQSSIIRSAYRANYVPTLRLPFFGFRVARTMRSDRRAAVSR
jgi:serine/threonine protein kinase/formylglycine-generating enzyme required for sulfatase activity